jgi:hypothetical protein
MPSGKKKRNGSETLKQEVREALLGVLRDNTAPATARASAGRTLYEMFKDEEGGSSDSKPAVEMSSEELDAEIARLAHKPGRTD